MRRGEKEILGPIQFGSRVDITDPCYNRDVWCRMNDVEVVPGDYTAIAYKKDKGEWGIRVATLGLYLNGVVPKASEMTYLGEIGVDSGMAGVFENKPDFSDEEWREFCDACDSVGYPTVLCRDHDLFHGVCVSSGYGDGGYDVYVAKNAMDHICALEIRFL